MLNNKMCSLYKMNEDLWRHIGTFLIASDICSLKWVFQLDNNTTTYFEELKYIIHTLSTNATIELLKKIKRPPQCITKGCTNNIEIEDIAEFYCFYHDHHEIIEYCSTPWYYGFENE